MKKLLLIAFSCFIMLSCSDDDLSSDKDDISIPGRTIYIAGYISDGISETACYWINGKKYELPGGTEANGIVVKDGKVYVSGYDFGGSAVYWIDQQKFELPGNGGEGTAIAVHGNDVYVAGGFNNGSCYWKNGEKINLTTGRDSNAYGVDVNQTGDVFVGGYYMNNHHTLIPAFWKNGQRANLSIPNGGDGEVIAVAMKNGNTPVYGGNTLRPHSFIGLLEKPSYWINGNRTDCKLGGSLDTISGGEARGIFVDGNDVYVAGNTSHFIFTNDGEEVEGTGGTYGHYWKNRNINDLPGGPINNYMVSDAYDVAVSDGKVVVVGSASSESASDVAAVWIDGELNYLVDKNTKYSLARSIYIE